MNYSARKIYLTCNDEPLNAWATFMRAHIEDVVKSLGHENVRHEMWFSGEDRDGLFVIGVMDVDDSQASAAVANASILEVDRVHREFKKHWDRTRIQDLNVTPARAPTFEGCTLLFEAKR
jgi:Family of unknown function (DUF6176)